MKKQKSYAGASPALFLVPTPIGNLDDMTPRAVETLKGVERIFAEDTRVTKVLLSHFNITTPMQSYHAFNEKTQVDKIIELLNSGKSVALVSDAGLPGISDPGYYAARRALDAGFAVIALPGPNAAVTALVASGLPCERFYFYGFLSSRKTQKRKELTWLSFFEDTLVFYEAPHRLTETVGLIYEILGDREIVIARELSKVHEEYIRGKAGEILSELEGVKGEIVIIVKGADQSPVQDLLNQKSIAEHYEHYLKLGLSPMEAVKAVAKDRGVAKNEIYKHVR